MAIEEVKAKPIEEKKENNAYKIRPKYGAWMEDDILILEVFLPGVKKDQIQLKTTNEYFTLRADRENFQYSLDLELNMEIVPEKTKARYEEGLLHCELFRYNPLEAAFIVPINGIKREVNISQDDDSYWILPDVFKKVDYKDNKIELEIAIPGVKEENINLKVLPEWFNLVAKHAKYEYRANSGFGTEIIPEKTTAQYSNGLLKISAVIHNRLDDALKVKIGE